MAEGGPRAGRDVAADAGWVALSAAGGLLFLIIKPGMRGTGLLPGPHALAFGIDAGTGAAASAALWFRRRWPAGIAVAMLVPFVVSPTAAAAVLLALLNVSIRRRAGVALAIAGLYLIVFPGYYLLWYSQYPFWMAWLWAMTEFAAVGPGPCTSGPAAAPRVAARAGRPREAAQKLLAEQARSAERTRIAQEMHDVLGHRISLWPCMPGRWRSGRTCRPPRCAEAAGADPRRPPGRPWRSCGPLSACSATAPGTARRRARRSHRWATSPGWSGVPPGRPGRRAGHAGRHAGGSAGSARPRRLPDRAGSPDQRKQTRSRYQGRHVGRRPPRPGTAGHSPQRAARRACPRASLPGTGTGLAARPNGSPSPTAPCPTAQTRPGTSF